MVCGIICVVLVAVGQLCLVEYSLCQNVGTGDSAITATQGENVILKCESSESNGNVKWRLNNTDIESSPRRRYLDNGNLLIRHIDYSQDIGAYLCVTENANNRTIFEPISIKVNWIKENISVILQYPEHLSDLKPGTDLKLKCNVAGSDVVKVDWTRNGERISHSEKLSLENEFLLIKQVTSRDNGVYRCTATNPAGTSISWNNFALIMPSEKCADIRLISQDKIYKKGVNVTLDCVFKNADLFEWYFEENGPLKNNSNFNVLVNGSLVIKHLQNEHQGMYACVGVKKECDTYPTKYTVVISLAELEETNSSLLDPSTPISHVVAQGENFYITCNPPKGNPKPVVIWKKTGQIIKHSGRVKTSGNDLIITNAKRDTDTGTYTCTVENIAGVRQSRFDLTVTVPPVITQHPRSSTVMEGNNVTLSCAYKGTISPFTRVQWYKNGALLWNNTSAKMVINLFDGSLNLVNVDISDAATYFCVINTTFFPPQRSQNATLIVIQKLKFNPLPVPKKMELGMSGKIPCKAEGKDPPVVKWIKENFSKNTAEALPENVQNLNGTLYFAKVQKDDKGRYTCVASNSQGTINVTVEVDVVVTPKFTHLPKNPSEGFEGYSITLDCAADGDPFPTIQWDSNQIDISQKRFQTLSNGSLRINELRLSDSGLYGCTAGNSGGFNRTEAYLNVRSWDTSKSDGSADGMESDTVGRTIAITLGAATAYILLVVVLMAWCRYRRRKKKQAYSEANGDVLALEDEDAKRNSKDTSESTREATNTTTATVKSVQNGVAGVVKSNQEKLDYSEFLNDSSDQFTKFSRQNLHDIMLLGNGEFGSVYLARNKCENDTVVMLKILEEAKLEFRRQLDILSQVQHERLVKLIGICREAEPLYMVLEYTDWGDLKQFLIATRKSSVRVVGNKQRPPPLTVPQSLAIIQQVCAALQHLTQNGFTHRQVAARNCLITSALNVKITFSSLCKDTYAIEYYEIRNQLLPLRWLPLEAVLSDDFSAPTDVYSFACLVWEVFTKGELPFSKLSDEEVLNLLEKRQLRWKLPKTVPPALAKLLWECWSSDSMARPVFARLAKELKEIANSIGQE